MPSIVGNMVVQNSNGSFNLGDFITFLQKKIQKLIMVRVHLMSLLFLIHLTVLVQQTHLILMLLTKAKLEQPKFIYFPLHLNKTQYTVNNVYTVSDFPSYPKA